MAGAKTKKSPKTRAASPGKRIGTSLKDARAPLVTNGKANEAKKGSRKAGSDQAAARKKEITLKAFRAAYETHHRKVS